MNRSLVGICASSAVLAGCMTTADALSQPPTISYLAAAPLPAVRDCILRRAEQVTDYLSVPVPPPQVVELQGVTKINFLADSRIFVELRPASGGTEVRYVRHLRKVRPAASIDGVIRDCDRAG